MDDYTLALIAIVILFFVGLLLDLIPERKIDWSDQLPSQKDNVRIVAGQQREQPRHLLKLSLLLVVVLVLCWLLA